MCSDGGLPPDSAGTLFAEGPVCRKDRREAGKIGDEALDCFRRDKRLVKILGGARERKREGGGLH